MNEYGICFAITDNATTIILVACAWVTCKNAFLRVENKKGNCRVIGTGNLSFNRYYQIALQWLYQILGSQTVYDTTFCSIPSFSSVQLLSRVRLFATPWTAACQASLSVTNSRSLLKLMSIELVMPSNHLNLCHPLLSSSPPTFNLSQHQSLFQWVSSLHRGPKYWSFSFSISPSNEYSGLIFFRMDWLDLLAVQGTLKSLLQYHRSKASILQHSAFFLQSNSHIHTQLLEKP